MLADTAYPLILKTIRAHSETQNVLQTTRIDLRLAVTVLDQIEEGCDILLVDGRGTGALEGHTNSVGSAAANTALSERRVELVREC